MKSICFFSSYFSENKIPYYVKYYLEELSIYFTEVVLLMNKKKLADSEIEYLSKRNIELRLYDNEGWDFGMWYKAMQEFDLLKYDRIGLINDSAILFKSLAPSFKWIDESGLDYVGLLSSKRIDFHIQSYFVIINKNAIKPVYEYFIKHGIMSDYKQVIIKYEVGLSSYLKGLNLKLGAQYYSKENVEIHNPSFLKIDEMIKEGLPLIKKKIISRAYRKGEYLTLFRINFNIDNRYYIESIKESNKDGQLIDFDLVLNDFGKRSNFGIYVYRVILALYKITSKSKLLTYLFHRLILLRRKRRGDRNKDIVVTSETKL